jgi:hypothetical protein
MKQDEKLMVEMWKEHHRLHVVSFWWKDRTGTGECRLKDKTYNQAMKIAKEFGYVDPRWFKPWTWSNGVVTVG